MSLSSTTIELSRKMLRVKIRSTFHQRLWQVRMLNAIKFFIWYIQTLINCRFKCSIFCEKNENHVSKVFSRDDVFSMNNTSICESIDENLSIVKFNENWWDKKKTKTHEKNEKIDRENDENNSLLLHFTKKNCRFTICEKFFRKRDMKRHRFSSSFFSSLENKTNENSKFNNYTSFKVRNISKSRLASSRLIDFEKNTNDDDKLKFAIERSRMIVIFEQQNWKRKIVDEKNSKQERERSRKQYLVEWKSFWMNDDRFIISNLTQNWKKKKASKDEILNL